MSRRIGLVVLLALLIVGALFCGPAVALTVSGGTDQENSYVREVIESCWLDYSLVDGLVGDVEVIFAEHYEPYWEVNYMDVWGLAWYGNIRIRMSAPASAYGEIAAHEWSHQIWYAMGPVWKHKWTALCTEGIEAYDSTAWYTMPAENFAECMKVALFPHEYLSLTYPRTNLNVISPEDSREFVDLWRWQRNTFADLITEDDELRAAAGYLRERGVIEGYTDGTVGPYFPLLKRHVALITERSGLPCALSVDDYTPATRADVRDAVPGLSWLEERWDESITRGQLMRLLYRARNDNTAVLLEQWFAETSVTWQGVSRSPRLIGHAQTLVDCSREYDVPLWLALGQCWRESQWGTTGLSINHNVLWGMKDTQGWGEIESVVSGFANYISVDECIRAYFRLMDAWYRDYIAAGDWMGLLTAYAPAFENDTQEHYAIVMVIRDKCVARGIR